MKPGKYTIYLFFCILLSACTPLVDDDRGIQASDVEYILETNASIGQTFVARHGGLRAIEIWLSPLEQIKDGEIVMHLFNDVPSSTPNYTSSILLQTITESNYYRFDISQIKDSHSSYYYAVFRNEGTDNTVSIRIGPANSYRDGAFYIENKPVDHQLAFRLVYDPFYVVLDLIGTVITTLRWLVYGVFLYILPGMALVLSLRHSRVISFGEIIGLSIGISFAIYPLFFLLTSWLGISLGAAYAWIPGLFSLVVLVYLYYRRGLSGDLAALKLDWASPEMTTNLLYIFIVVVLCVSRLLPIRGIRIPLWGDSVQHVAITQLFLDNSGIFENWLPYTPYKGLSMHFGFHALSASFAWITHLAAPESTLITGQLVNIAAILTIYPLAVKLSSGRKWAGLIAMLVAGLFSPMPGMFVNWGRYPQLAGLAILPVAIWLVTDAVDHTHLGFFRLALASIVVAGMALSYYRMPYFFTLYILVWITKQIFSKANDTKRYMLGLIVKLAVIAVLVLLLLFPWINHIQGGTLMTHFTGWGTKTSTLLSKVLVDYRIWRDISTYVPTTLIILFGFGFVLSCIRKSWDVIVIGFWAIGMALLVMTRLIRLPGSNMINNFGVVISLYIPATISTGWLSTELSSLLKKHITISKWIFVLLYTSLALSGLSDSLTVVDPFYMMVNQPDLQAMAWIRKYTRTDATFLVEGFHNLNESIVVGSDAGWWIPLLTKRSNTIPPGYAIIDEKPIEKSYTQNMVKLVSTIQENGMESAETLQVLCDFGITHVYIGQGRGKVGVGVPQLFSVQEITSSPTYVQRYKKDLVRIYELAPEICENA